MPHIRQVDDVSIVDWDPARLPDVVGQLRSLVDGGGAQRVLINMSRAASLAADNLESLTEAATVCRDRGCSVGMFALADDLARLVELMGLDEYLPRVVGDAEDQAVASIRDGLAEGVPDLEIELPPPEDDDDEDVLSPTAPTARFDPVTIEAAPTGAPSPQRFEQQSADDLLMVDWADLTKHGYRIGGKDAEEIQTATAGATTAPPPPPTPREGEDYIDVGDLDGRSGRRTEVIPAFQLDEGASPEGWSAEPQKAGAEFSADDLSSEPAGVFGAEDGGDFSPLDTGQEGPPAFLRSQPAAPPQQRPAQQRPPQQAPPEPGQQQPGRDEPTRPHPGPRREAAAAPAGAGTSPYYDGDGDDQTVMFQPGVLPGDPALLQPPGYAGEGQAVDDEEQTVMFQPGEQEMALLAGAASAPTPPMGVPTPDEFVPDVADDEDQTVMFQPGAFDAALLAEVAAAAGPETPIPAPEVEEPPKPQRPADVAQLPDGNDVELRLFMHDHAITSDLHLQLLDRFVKAGEDCLGPVDVSDLGAADRSVVLGALDQFVQSRLLRRTRSTRVRGGTGYLFAPSPHARATTLRLLKTWQAPATRSKVVAWLDE